MGLGANIAALAALKAEPAPNCLVLWEPVLDGPNYLERLIAAHREDLAREMDRPWQELVRRGEPEPTVPGSLLGFMLGPCLHNDLQQTRDLPLQEISGRGTRIVMALRGKRAQRFFGFGRRGPDLADHRDVQPTGCPPRRWERPSFHRRFRARCWRPCEQTTMNEQTLIFGPENHLVGTVTLPDTVKPGHERTMALLTNAGVIPRIGPHRLNVQLARRFAEIGIATLRFDMSGLGDSRRSSSRRPTGEQFVADTLSAMDLAQAKFGCDQFFMVGFCSGGDVAHNAALLDARLRAIVMWDSYVYPTRKAKLRGLIHRLRRHTLTSAAQKVIQRLLAPRGKPAVAEDGQPPEGPSIFGRTRMPPRDEFGQRIRTLVDRGVELLFLYSGGEPEWYNYHGQFRDMFSLVWVRRSGCLRVHRSQ